MVLNIGLGNHYSEYACAYQLKETYKYFNSLILRLKSHDLFTKLCKETKINFFRIHWSKWTTNKQLLFDWSLKTKVLGGVQFAAMFWVSQWWGKMTGTHSSVTAHCVNPASMWNTNWTLKELFPTPFNYSYSSFHFKNPSWCARLCHYIELLYDI